MSAGTALAPFQTEGVRWLTARKRGLLADDPGLGKTRQALLAALSLLGKARLSDPTAALHWGVVVAPANALAVWRREAELLGFAPGQLFVVDGKSRRPSNGAMPLLVVISYDTLTRSRLGALHPFAETAGFSPTLVIADESHYIKSPGAKRTRMVTALALRAHYVWLLTGTPIKGYYDEYYTTARLLAPYKVLAEQGLRSYYDWRDRFCITEKTTIWVPRRRNYMQITRVVGNRNAGMLKELLRPYVLRRRKQDVLPQLPALSWQALPVEMGQRVVGLTPEEIAEMEHAAETGRTPVSGHIATRRAVLATALVPVAYKVVLDHLEATSDPIVVFCCHLEALDVLERMLGAARVDEKPPRVARITGATPPAVRGAIQDRFQAGEIDVLLGQVHAAGTAITLTRANRVLFIDLAWSPADNKQARDRVHRIGQTRACIAQYLAPLDDPPTMRVNEILAMKTAALDAVEMAAIPSTQENG